MDIITDNSLGFISSTEEIISVQERPRFTYVAGEVEYDKDTPKPDCCKHPNKFRVYNRDHSNLLPRGLCCVNCDTEYLDLTDYRSVIVDHGSEVEVSCLETETADTDLEASDRFSRVNPRIVVLQKKTSRFKFSPGVACLSMGMPHRRYIPHHDPNVINELRPGDHIAWVRTYTLWHHQLIRNNKGNGKCDVIQFDVLEWCAERAKVHFTDDYDFTKQENGTAYKILYDETIENENPLKLILDRANSRLLEENYNILVNNCEHLITFFKTGKRQSLQINWLLMKVLFLLLRVILLAVIVAFVVFCDYQNDDNINKNEEVIELVFVIASETLFGIVPITLWHLYLYRKHKIEELDRNRRILEALLEGIITISFYFCHVLFMNIVLIKKWISEGHWKGVLHISFAVLFGVVGKIIGCIAGHAIAQCLLRPSRNRRRRRRASMNRQSSLYGAIVVHR
ncbi:hypothetical protein BSL78_00275 [Apostichopus japonicus]|uniref:LRAT domain-containing protein n=1 Tax=Stichopus japonicus TaxID=307972 RepID=A0A2G8LRH7_STIJA|nr:hypothetical protein BSL78_00275 [Apostichopus japonicus]